MTLIASGTYQFNRVLLAPTQHGLTVVAVS